MIVRMLPTSPIPAIRGKIIPHQINSAKRESSLFCSLLAESPKVVFTWKLISLIMDIGPCDGKTCTWETSTQPNCMLYSEDAKHKLHFLYGINFRQDKHYLLWSSHPCLSIWPRMCCRSLVVSNKLYADRTLWCKYANCTRKHWYVSKLALNVSVYKLFQSVYMLVLEPI